MAKTKPSITVASRRLIAENQVWNIYFARVLDGERPIPDYLVVEPKICIADAITGVCIVPMVEGKIGLVRVFRVALADTFLEAPKGFVDEDEDAADAALRELGEETGFTCGAADLIALGTLTQEASTLAARVKLYAALNCRATAQGRESETGLAAIEFHAADEVLKMAADSRIEDATTVAAIYRLMARRDLGLVA